MNEEQLKAIIIALIENGKFYIGKDNEDTAKKVAKFTKAYYAEMKI